MKSISVVTVGETPGGLVGDLAASQNSVGIVRRCPELSALLAACQSGLAQAAIIADGTEDLSATLVDRLAAVGVAVVAITADPSEGRRLEGFGAVVVGDDASVQMLCDAVLRAVAARAHPSTGGYAHAWDAHAPHSRAPNDPTPSDPTPSDPTPNDPTPQGRPPRGGDPQGRARLDGELQEGNPHGRERRDPGPGSAGGVDRRLDDHPGTGRRWPMRWTTARRRVPASESPKAPEAPGRLLRPKFPKRPERAERPQPAEGPEPRTLAVWGPLGSPGRTTVAVNLAAELAAAGRVVLLVDADTYGSSVAASLGLLDESASLAHACRLADQGLLTAEALERAATEIVFAGGTMRVLTGLTRADRWPEIRPAALDRVLAAGRDLADVVVVDCGFCLEDDEELSYDSLAPRRNAATLCAVDAADVVYAVGAADAIGLPRLIKALPDLLAVTGNGEVQVVLNKVRKGAAGRSPRGGLEDAWERFGPAVPIGHFLPWDPDAADRALLNGKLLQEAVPDAPLRRALAALCAADQQKRVPVVPRTPATAENKG